MSYKPSGALNILGSVKFFEGNQLHFLKSPLRQKPWVLLEPRIPKNVGIVGHVSVVRRNGKFVHSLNLDSLPAGPSTKLI